MDRKVIHVLSDHISIELQDGHPTTNGNVDSANDYHVLSCDASSFSNPPSTIDEPYIVA